jgi:hypothetical protein
MASIRGTEIVYLANIFATARGKRLKEPHLSLQPDGFRQGDDS